MVHETVYEPSETGYNEALATFIAKEASLLFFAGDRERRLEAERIFADRLRFADLLDRLSAELDAFYASVGTTQEALAGREAIFERFQHEEFEKLDWQTKRYASFQSRSLNNAWLLAQTTYLGELDCFAAWLERLNGDLEALIRAVTEQPGHVPLYLAACAPA